MAMPQPSALPLTDPPIDAGPESGLRQVASRTHSVLTLAGFLDVIAVDSDYWAKYPDVPQIWLKFDQDNKKFWGLRRAEAYQSGDFAWQNANGDGTETIVIELQHAVSDDKCTRVNKLLVIGQQGVLKASDEFGECLRLTEAAQVPGGADLSFVHEITGAQKQVTLRRSELTFADDTPVRMALVGLPEILVHAGEHPTHLLVPAALERIKAITGNKIEDFVDSLDVASGCYIFNDWLVASGGKAHMGDTHSSALYINVYTHQFIAMIFRYGVATLYGVHAGANVPDVVSSSIKVGDEIKKVVIAR
jgi:hypothetical protein